MENINNDNAAQWVGRFLDGNTTCAQEQEIYAYFQNDDIPAELEQYREMFAWYANGMRDEPVNKKSVRVSIIRYVSIAASIALIVSIGFHYFKAYTYSQQEYAIYEGSYIIRDGEKITDIDKILPELKHAEQIACEYSRMQSVTIESNDDYMLQVALQGVSNPQIRQAIAQALSE